MTFEGYFDRSLFCQSHPVRSVDGGGHVNVLKMTEDIGPMLLQVRTADAKMHFGFYWNDGPEEAIFTQEIKS